MRTSKRKLNLTISLENRELAEKLAQHYKRSLSNLFEVLVEEEWERVRAEEERNNNSFRDGDGNHSGENHSSRSVGFSPEWGGSFCFA